MSSVFHPFWQALDAITRANAAAAAAACAAHGVPPATSHTRTLGVVWKPLPQPPQQLRELCARSLQLPLIAALLWAIPLPPAPSDCCPA
eukprot:7173616-Prymnesium_polylepis.1